jgi:hypothetical protein
MLKNQLAEAAKLGTRFAVFVFKVLEMLGLTG